MWTSCRLFDTVVESCHKSAFSCLAILFRSLGSVLKRSFASKIFVQQLFSTTLRTRAIINFLSPFWDFRVEKIAIGWKLLSSNDCTLSACGVKNQTCQKQCRGTRAIFSCLKLTIFCGKKMQFSVAGFWVFRGVLRHKSKYRFKIKVSLYLMQNLHEKC